MAKPSFWNNTKRYYDLKSYWLNRFGCRVHKLPIDAGFTCPNRDNTIAEGGCIYCDSRGSALRRAGALPSVGEQVRRGKAFYRERPKAEKFIAYFQTFTNTYAPAEKLRALYSEALAEEDVIGLSIGTRPDCVPDETLDLIRSYADRYHVWIEFGLQSIHDRTLREINRGHDAKTFVDAVKRVGGGPTRICVHIIVGLPGETHAEILETAHAIAALPIEGIKIHSLLALRGTALGDRYARGEIPLMTRDEYVSTVCDILEILPPRMVIQRLTADGYREILLAPEWVGNKLAVLNAIDRELSVRDSWQGKEIWRRTMIGIVDYRAGNLTSVARALEYLKEQCIVTSDAEILNSASHIIFPGVGAAGAAMANLLSQGLDVHLRKWVAEGKPVLGICLGTQVIFEYSEEDDTDCLGIVPGSVRHFPADLRVDGRRLKIPHMGWNSVAFSTNHPVFSGIPEGAEFYFVHSYYPAPSDERWAAGWTDYGIRFCSAVARGSLVAVQFHPEKSGRPGLTILANFCRWGGNHAQ